MIVEISEMPVAEGKEAIFADTLSAFHEIFMSIPDAVETRWLVDKADPKSFMLFMQWQTKDARRALEQDPRFQEWAKVLDGLFEGKPKVRSFDEIL